MRKIVVNSLYSHREIFLRELISNSNDALEKLRLVSLTDKSIIDSADPLNITIKAIKNEDGNGGKLVITDTGIGMSPEDMVTNLGTLAKSGTSEFISKAESGGDSGNLIGSFGLGFYSSFLVADEVQVASIPPKSSANPTPVQYIFSSKSDENSFDTYPDPRGNTLGGHGTEIILTLRDDAKAYLNTDTLKSLVEKHSSFSTTYPIWLFTEETSEVPIEDEKSKPESKPESKEDRDASSEEAVVEDVQEEAESSEPVVPKTITVTEDKWVHLNSQAPIWMRDPKTVTDEEYKEFYKVTFKDYNDPPLAWHHFQGDSGSGVSFRAIIYIPGSLSREFWNSPTAENNVRLMVKRVFITSDLGEDGVAKWASWLKVIIDAEDLPLNVSRESLQSNKFIKQIKQIVVKRLIQMLSQMAEKDPAKYQEIVNSYGNALKLGAVEDTKDRRKLAGLSRWPTNHGNFTSLDEYVSRRKKGQKQIFFYASIGQKPEVIAQSIFIEKLVARGYEVFLLSEPLDEFLFGALASWEGLQFQDTAKKGLLFGDEDKGSQKQREEEQKAEFASLLKYLKDQIGDLVRDVVISNRLVTSPCAIVAETHGYSANMERIMNAQNTKKSMQFMHEFAKKQRVLEINPHSPLIQGLLRRVNQLGFEDEDREADPEAEAELKEVTAILIDGALIRSGFDVSDSNMFFTRIDQVLRRSLGVSEHAKADVEVTPAPPVDEEPIDPEDAKPRLDLPDHLKDHLDVVMEEIPDDEDDYGNKLPEHDEL